MGEVIDLADHRAVLVVEAALARPILAIGVAEVPLADDGGAVTRVLERLRQQPLIGRQAVFGRGRDDQRLQAVAKRVAPRHQRRPRRRAHRLSVELLETRALLRQRIDIRRLDVGAVKADVLPPEVVGDDVDDVGARRLLLSGGRGGRHQRRRRQNPGDGQRQSANRQQIAALYSSRVIRRSSEFLAVEIAHSVPL